jgi:hypothetical protein
MGGYGPQTAVIVPSDGLSALRLMPPVADPD